MWRGRGDGWLIAREGQSEREAAAGRRCVSHCGALFLAVNTKEDSGGTEGGGAMVKAAVKPTCA
jgi:hypothetical protein